MVRLPARTRPGRSCARPTECGGRGWTSSARRARPASFTSWPSSACAGAARSGSTSRTPLRTEERLRAVRAELESVAARGGWPLSPASRSPRRPCRRPRREAVAPGGASAANSRPSGKSLEDGASPGARPTSSSRASPRPRRGSSIEALALAAVGAGDRPATRRPGGATRCWPASSVRGSRSPASRRGSTDPALDVERLPGALRGGRRRR